MQISHYTHSLCSTLEIITLQYLLIKIWTQEVGQLCLHEVYLNDCTLQNLVTDCSTPLFTYIYLCLHRIMTQERKHKQIWWHTCKIWFSFSNDSSFWCSLWGGSSNVSTPGSVSSVSGFPDAGVCSSFSLTTLTSGTKEESVLSGSYSSTLLSLALTASFNFCSSTLISLVNCSSWALSRSVSFWSVLFCSLRLWCSCSSSVHFAVLSLNSSDNCSQRQQVADACCVLPEDGTVSSSFCACKTTAQNKRKMERKFSCRYATEPQRKWQQ